MRKGYCLAVFSPSFIPFYKVLLGSLRYLLPKERFLKSSSSDIPVVLRENTLTISHCIEAGSPVEYEIVKVVTHSTTEITEITRLKTRFPGSEYL